MHISDITRLTLNEHINSQKWIVLGYPKYCNSFYGKSKKKGRFVQGTKP